MKLGKEMEYEFYYKFFESFAMSGFEDIDPENQVMVGLEKMNAIHNQFFYIEDILLMRLLYISNKCKEFFGSETHKLLVNNFIKIIHQEDTQKFSILMVNAYKIAHSLFLEGTGSKLLSAIIRLQRLDGQYSNIYLQQYLFYSIRPYESVFMFQIHTDLNWYKATRTRHYFCIDNDVSNFRYPDQEMLAHGRNLSDREFQIINLVSSGLNSEQIAKKLCLSKHTINTHRRNILQKTRTINLHRPVIDLYKQDFF